MHFGIIILVCVAYYLYKVCLTKPKQEHDQKKKGESSQEHNQKGSAIPPDVVIQLKKIMEMTRSNHDGEALVAMRKANIMLKKYNITWTELIQ